ncbi:hypothetical protein EDD16DRAFT_1528137 [Pisolithus croceorrhizus]|nr:hypothetical protein EDD16DRAFT_1528137 [Pisolithus croceorrhizus]KAI6117421.1 hypothetical protein EV401DRAFT_1888951 [Pisolithus croceorrhizus]KAI6169908.1 hypothetical protein EDD17DRAFT_1502799 [Pisolithus thermaeus]
MDDSAITAIQMECIFTILPSKNMEISHVFVLQHPAISLVDILPIENREELGGSLPQVESSSVWQQATPGKHNSMEALQAYGEESPSLPLPLPLLETEFDIQSNLFEQMKNARVPQPPSPTQTPDNQADIEQEPYSELFEPPTLNVSPDENEDSQSDTFKRLQAARVPSPLGESTMDVSEQMENIVSMVLLQAKWDKRLTCGSAARVPSPPEFEDVEVSEAMEGVRLPSPSPPLDSDLFERMRIVVVPPAPTPLELEGREEIHADFGWPIDFGDLPKMDELANMQCASLASPGTSDDAYNVKLYLGSPQYPSKQSLIEMGIVYMGCHIECAVIHLLSQDDVSEWPVEWFLNISMDLVQKELDHLVLVSVCRQCPPPPLPTCYHAYLRWKDNMDEFQNELCHIPKESFQLVNSISTFIPTWSPQVPDKYGGFAFPWWLSQVSTYSVNFQQLRGPIFSKSLHNTSSMDGHWVSNPSANTSITVLKIWLDNLWPD